MSKPKSKYDFNEVVRVFRKFTEAVDYLLQKRTKSKFEMELQRDSCAHSLNSLFAPTSEGWQFRTDGRIQESVRYFENLQSCEFGSSEYRKYYAKMKEPLAHIFEPTLF